MRYRRKLLVVALSITGLLSTAFAAPTYAFQDGENDGQWCIEEGGTWDGTMCSFPQEEWDEEQWCYDEGGTWDGTMCSFPWDGEEWQDDGSIWSAPDQESCIERGGIWESQEDWGYCWEDSGEAWDARDQPTCEERGGTWESADPQDPQNSDGWCIAEWDESN